MDKRGMTLADAAVELKLFQSAAGEVAFAVMIAGMVQNVEAFRIEVLAARCGITEAVADKIIYDAHRGAALIGQAHAMLAQIARLGIEDEITSLIARRAAEVDRVMS